MGGQPLWLVIGIALLFTVVQSQSTNSTTSSNVTSTTPASTLTGNGTTIGATGNSSSSSASTSNVSTTTQSPSTTLNGTTVVDNSTTVSSNMTTTLSNSSTTVTQSSNNTSSASTANVSTTTQSPSSTLNGTTVADNSTTIASNITTTTADNSTTITPSAVTTASTAGPTGSSTAAPSSSSGATTAGPTGSSTAAPSSSSGATTAGPTGSSTAAPSSSSSATTAGPSGSSTAAPSSSSGSPTAGPSGSSTAAPSSSSGATTAGPTGSLTAAPSSSSSATTAGPSGSSTAAPSSSSGATTAGPTGSSTAAPSSSSGATTAGPTGSSTAAPSSSSGAPTAGPTEPTTTEEAPTTTKAADVLCDNGYRKDDEKGCVDIDECIEELDNCDDEDRSKCTNTKGSFKCECKTGFDGDGTSCLYNRLFSSAEATVVADDKIISKAAYITDGGVPVFDNVYGVINSMYATKSGMIYFTNYKQEENRVPSLSYSKPTKDTLQEYSDLYLKEERVVAVAAAYWADTNGGKLYTQAVRNVSEMDSKDLDAIKTVFTDPDWVYIVTWSKMVPNGGERDPSELNTFQAIVVTDAKRTNMKVIYRYQDGQMSWKLVTSTGNYPARIGLMFNSKDRKAEEYEYSGWSKKDENREKIVSPDQYNQTGVEVGIQEAGVFVYDIVTKKDSSESSGYKCKKWLDGESPQWELSFFSQTCPSFESQVLPGIFYDKLNDWCYQDVDPVSLSDGSEFLIRCCYEDGGALYSPDILGAQNLDGMTTVVKKGSNSDADQIFPSCCGFSNLESGETPFAMCEDFLTLRPPGRFDRFVAFIMALLAGDPHITTLDGTQYTFNGHGEFVMIETSDGPEFAIQGRTGRVNLTGDATVFTGFAAQLNGGATIQVSFPANFSSVELYINGTLQNNHDWNTMHTEGNVRLFNDSGPYTLTFDNGIAAKIDVSLELKMMTLNVIANPKLQGKLKGLMGNFNGNKTDEFLYPNGTMASDSVTFVESEIYPWGLTWMTSDSTSLFTYGSGQNWTDYNDPGFVPEFFNPNLTIMFPDEATRTAAIALCNKGAASDETPEERRECYFDYKVTGNAAFAEATVATGENFVAEKTKLANFAPFITSPNATFQVEAGKTYSNLFTVTANDSNGDNITFTVSTGPTGLSIAADGTVSWTSVEYAENSSVVITASDGAANAVFSPQVVMCDCKNAGTCKWDVQNIAAWYVVPCDCAPGWAGVHCDEDLDGCADAPCFTSCTDVVASQVSKEGAEFLCDPCPAGLLGDGQTCYDENECLTTKPCDQECENTAGSFVCSCNKGYALDVDGRSCVDIDECLLKTHDCDDKAECTNTVGAWTCTCDSGYEGDGKVDRCVNIDECAKNLVNCTEKSSCVDTEGSYECVCDRGYKANGDECENINECALGNDCDQICVDGIASYTCDCEENFVLNSTDKKTCEPDIACSASEKLKCDGGKARSTCAKDKGGELLCYCPQGLTTDANKDCVDIDECVTGDNICSAATSVCNNTEPGYMCECKDGFQRSADLVTCEDMDECEDDTDNCDQDCVNSVGSFICTCDSGYKLHSNGSTCLNIDECASDVTNNCDSLNGDCTDKEMSDDYPLGYMCGCKTGYKLSDNGFTCTDLNECTLDDQGGCAQGCTNSIGSYSCFCGGGYALNTTDKKTCDDVDECTSDSTHNCYSSSLCTNTVGGYTCSCPAEFTLKSDGFTCESIKKCQSGHNCSYTCSVMNSTDTCQCPRGYSLNSDGKSCQDTDECALGLDACKAENNVKCVNDEPGYHCTCVSDKYVQVEDAKCIDLDECASGAAKCRDNSYCSNKDNGYDCPCNKGYADNGVGACTDIKECLTGDNTCHKTLATCTDFDGGYSCECKEGYNGNGIDCTDINECAGDNDCEPNPDSGICTNTEGSYNCSCATGYQIQPSGLCLDINECDSRTTYNVKCSQSCINTPSSFKCGCTDGYKLDTDGVSCSPQVACSNTTVCDHNCLKRDGKDMCTCNPGYSLSTADNSTCIDIDECATNTSTCDKTRGICENVDGSFKCSCKDGYTVGPAGECEDRDGGFGDWGAYANCTETCGEEGEQTRTRTCDNPTPQGKGAECKGDATETVPCNRVLCENQLQYGVEIDFEGVSNELFLLAKDVFKQNATNSIEAHCTADSAAAQECCGVSYSLASPVNKTFMTTDNVDVSSRDMTKVVGVTVVLTVVVNVETNDVCSANASVNGRRKRALSFFSQSLLLTILSDNTVITDLVNEIETALSSFNVTISNTPTPVVAQQITVAPPSTTAAATTASTTKAVTTAKTTESEPEAVGKTPGWVIAVAVVSALVVVAIIIIVVVVLLKRPRKVGAGGQDNEATR